MGYWLQKNEKGWWLMGVDEEPQRIPHACYLKLQLYEKEALNQEDVERIQDFIQREAAQKVFSRLSPTHNKSAKQIIQKLVDNKIPEEFAKKIVMESVEEGRIDDMETIGRWIRDSENHRFRSRKSLFFELLKRGFKKEDIEYSLREIPNLDELAIQKLCKKRFVQQLSQEKLIQYFVNKGFSMDTIRRTLSEISEHE